VYAHRLDEADQNEVSILSLQSEKIKNITSAIPDVMRSIQMLPGVSTNNEFNAKFNVRGGNQDENLVLVNGTQVYDPFHIKEAPNASIGIFNVDMIKKMDLVTGGFTARYGDKMSSVLNIEYREGSREQYKGIASLSMTDAGAIVEGPLGENGSFILGGRKSYLENVLRMLNVGSNIHISFYDIQGVLAYSLSPQQKFLLKFIHAGDDFTMDPRRGNQGPSSYTTYPYGYPVPNTVQSGDFEDNSGTYYSSMVAFQSVNILSSSALLKSEVSFYDQREAENFLWTGYYEWQGIYRQNTYFYKSNTERLYINNLRIRTLEFNSTLDMQLTSSYGIKTGVSYQSIDYNQDQNYSGILEESRNDYHYPDTSFSRRVENSIDNTTDSLNTHSYKITGYLENIIQLSDRVLLNVGGRFDYFDLNKDLTWSPRINIAYRTGIGVVIRGAWGHY
jgi:outer membrane receptor for ferrienterochelin and colicin